MRKLLFLALLFSSLSFSAQNFFLEEFANGLSSPVEITNANDNRLFVVQQNGIIKIIQPNGIVNATDFLNISNKIIFNGERGLLGLAFHPQYSTNGYFFVYYNNTAGNIVVARYTVSSTNANLADNTSEKIILNIPKPFDNHNGGSMHFAPDGYLWIATGDGGGGGDPNNNSQNKNSLLGKILRIDINTTNPYNIPPNNPFIGSSIDGADEVWSYGLRNSWKFSFDKTLSNVMIADVGQNAFEEINKIPLVSGGINYGWRCYEGNTIYNNSGCATSSSLTFPVAIYDHSGGKCSITGGYVYRGTAYPNLQGLYFFADYCSKQIGTLDSNNTITWSSPFANNNFSTFGEDNLKEMYVAAINNGKIYKIKSTTLSTQNNIIHSVKIYPNPAYEKVFIDGLNQKNSEINLINSVGQIVIKNKKLDAENSFNIAEIPSGVYFLNFKLENNKEISQKLIIK